jgi:hypothetical protein
VKDVSDYGVSLVDGPEACVVVEKALFAFLNLEGINGIYRHLLVFYDEVKLDMGVYCLCMRGLVRLSMMAWRHHSGMGLGKPWHSIFSSFLDILF